MKTKFRPNTGRKNRRTITGVVEKLMITTILIIVLLGCSKDDNSGGPVADSIYSGTGNFTFTGDFNESFIGNVENTKIGEQNGVQMLPMSFVDSQGRGLMVSVTAPKIISQTYNLQSFDAATNEAGFASIVLSGERYGSDAIGGKGSVTISAVSNKKISGSVAMRLARPLNTADTVVVVGSFELKSN